MSVLSKIVSKTIGVVSPKYRTLSQWAVIYNNIIQTKTISAKTKDNRKNYLSKILVVFGDTAISKIRSCDISIFIAEIQKTHPQLARRVLVELQCLFEQALLARWIEEDPSLVVKRPRVTVSRQRLSLSEWEDIYNYTDCCSPPWVSRLLLLALITGQRRGDLLKMRFSNIWINENTGIEYLRIKQEKTGVNLAIPLDIKLNILDKSLREVIESCRSYAILDSDNDGYLLRKTTGGKLSPPSASWRFEQAREAVLGIHSSKGTPASLHEIRSLAERLYREQGINTMQLLGHTSQTMTDLYNRDRGLSSREGQWKTVVL